MPDRYVFELQFKGKDPSFHREEQFVIVDGDSMIELTKLKEDLAKCNPEPFTLHYLDDEDDIIPVDTEEEFKEFAKMAQYRSSKGMLMKLILDSNVSNQRPQHDDEQHEDPNTLDELKSKIKQELKMEILSELKGELWKPSVSGEAQGGYGTSDIEDYCLLPPGAFRTSQSDKKGKINRKLDIKERFVEAKIDQRLEKLEMKKKKLLEKAAMRPSFIRRICDSNVSSSPCIMSGIATRETSIMTKKVNLGKTFSHMWHVINDGTVKFKNVELRHIWSTPGLEPEKLNLTVPALVPGQLAVIGTTFKAPKTAGSFISYWHFYCFEDSNWKQFGHYVFVSGITKLSKTQLAASCKTSETKTLKEAIKTVKFNEVNEPAKENKVLNDELNLLDFNPQEVCRNHLEASLASSEIAAEMAKKAAKLSKATKAIRKMDLSNSNKKPSEVDKLNDCLEVVESSPVLNLLDCGSDTDANVETNEDSDPGFVFVDVPSCFLNGEMKGDKTSNFQVKAKINAKSNEVEILELQNKVEHFSISSMETVVEPFLQEKSPDKVPDMSSLSVNEDSGTSKTPENTLEESTKQDISNGKQEEFEEPLSFPRLDPNVNYPVFPPPPPRVTMPIFPPCQNNMSVPPPGHNYSIFTPHSSASPGMILPPQLIQITAPKLNHLPYHHIPTYPPLPGSSPSVPIIAPSHPVLPHPTIAPQMNPPIYQHPMYPRAYGYDMSNCAAPQNGPLASSSQIHSSTPSSVSIHTNSSSGETSHVNTFSSSSSNTISQTVTSQARETLSTDSSNQTESVEKSKKTDSGVQILPQVLVDGAISVASSAYSTAVNALNNLRPKEEESIEFDPVFENNMAILVEMGFNNLERNGRLLKRFNNDISQVIGVICATGGGHNLDID